MTNMWTIYISRVYYNTFPDFEQFRKYKMENIPILNSIGEKLENESTNEGYVFNESFINPNIYENYKNIIQNVENENFSFEIINNNIDAFY